MTAGDISRRTFLRKSLQIGVGAAISGPIAASSGVTLLGVMGHQLSGTSDPISSQKVDTTADAYRGVLSDVAIGGVKFKLYGVSHNGKFAEENYEVIDDLVRNSSLVVLEANPDDIESAIVSNSAKAYFGTIINLCHKYGKPIISIDPFSVVADVVQGAVSGLAITTSVVKSFKVAAPVQTRRRFLNNLGLLAVGLYFFSGSQFSDPLKLLLAKGASKLFDSEHTLEQAYMALEPYSFYHDDQRNVELTERLLRLPPKLSAAELSGGDYVLANFGLFHTLGIDWYLKHPAVRRTKDALYNISYGLIDSNSQSKFIPAENGWQRVPL